jgi:hypothetical protein
MYNQDREQFGNQGARQFGQQRKEWPFISRKTTLFDHGGQIIAETNGILPYDQIRMRYRDVGSVNYSCNVKFAGQWVNGIDITVPFAALESIRTTAPGADDDDSNPLAGIMSQLMQDPTKLSIVSKLISGQGIDANEQLQIGSLLKSFLSGGQV